MTRIQRADAEALATYVRRLRPPTGDLAWGQAQTVAAIQDCRGVPLMEVGIAISRLAGDLTVRSPSLLSQDGHWWYRAGAGTTTAAASEVTPDPADRLATPAVVLWPEFDALFPREWSDRIDAFFSQARLRPVDGVGHYAPLEYPSVVAEEVRGFLASR